MHPRLLALACLVTVTTFAADAPKLPAIPEQPIAKKKELLFSDDFERAELGKAWAIVVPTFSIEKGALKGTQMRFDAPAVEAAGDVKAKPAVKGHQAVIGNDIPTKDSVIEFRFRLGGAQSVTAEFDDRAFNGSHYGHLCMARISAKSVILTDQKGLAVARPADATGEPPTPAGRRSVTFPVQLDTENLAHLRAGDGGRRDARDGGWKSGRVSAIARHRAPDEVEGGIRLHGEGWVPR
jgi:hypothetical protein